MPELINADESLWEIIGEYKKFSSVEGKSFRKFIISHSHNFNFSFLETFEWMRSHSFEKYSFHFGRYNIPFYALPFVNFFIINEMGGSVDEQQLLDALQQLQYNPSYHAKGW